MRLVFLPTSAVELQAQIIIRKMVIIVKGNYTAAHHQDAEIEKHLKYLSIVDRLLRGIGEPRGVAAVFFSFQKR